VRGADEGTPWWEGRISRSDCPRGPEYHVHLAPATTAVVLFVVSVALGKSGWLLGLVPVLLLLSALTAIISMRHLDPSSGGGG
jgi:CHASE2 domain-containing sensor protein